MLMIRWGPFLGKGRSPAATGARPRAAAALAVQEVLGPGRALDEALEQRLAGLEDPRDRGLVQEITYGVLRFLPRLRLLAGRLLQRPMKRKDLDLECLLLAGLYQLLYLRVPAHAAVSETVAATRLLDKSWAAGLLNGVLRGFERRREELLAALESNPAARWCFPGWLLERLQRAWPDDWETLVEQCNRRPPMALRVNAARTSRGEYAGRLAAAGLAARPLAHAPQGLVLDRPVDVQALPGFGDGDVSVQDGAAQLAAPLLQPQAGQRILDACAAPGGKTAHILELAPDAEITAVDVSPQRLEPLRANLSRLGLQARVVAGDVTDPAAGPWAEGEYQRILLDVPCSATGVIRRHPDIKWLRRAVDVHRLVGVQGRILDALWPRLAPGGILVYATCSLLPEENHQQMEAFFRRTGDARELPIEARWGRPCSYGRQLLTGDDDMDGFYYARLTKAG
jgi:16S rRNA (cytosine967-C5)-methyltransferase